jgi:hypothetical protein
MEIQLRISDCGFVRLGVLGASAVGIRILFHRGHRESEIYHEGREVYEEEDRDESEF